MLGGSVGMAVSLVGGMLLGGAAKPKMDSLGTTATDRKLTLRSNIESRKLVYGTVMVSGPLALKTTTGDTKQFLHLVVPLAGRKVTAIAEHMFDSTPATASRVSAKSRIRTHLGSVRQEADADLVAEVPGWTTAHRGRGVAYVYARLEYDTNAWPNGIKNVKGVVKGHALYDPRLPVVDIASTDAGSPALLHTSEAHGLAVDDEVFLLGHPHLDRYYVVDSVPTTDSLTLCDAVSGAPVALVDASTGGGLSRLRWSNNAALAILDYLLCGDGLNANLAETDADYWTAAANACDEQVALGAESACTADPATDIITLAQAVPWQTGLAVRMSSTGTLPGGVDAATSYAWIRLTPTTGRLAATKEDALYGLGISVSGAGSGTHTLSCALSCTLDAAANTVTLADTVPRDGDGSDDADQDEISPQFGWDTGDGVRLVSGTPPSGLSLGVTYYWVRSSNASGQLAASHDDAIAGTVLDISAAGSGLCIARVSQPRYTANGVVDLGAKPIDSMEKLLTSCGGVVPYVQGRYRLHPAVAQSATFTLTDSDARGPLTVQPRPSKRDVFNAVRGTFVDPTQLWEPSDLPSVTSDQYRHEDGGEQIWKDVELAFTVDCLRGQRLLKIILECARQGMTVEFPARLTAGPGSTLSMAPWDVGALYIERLGFSGKLFQLHSWRSADDLGVDLVLQEYASQALDWDPAEASHPDYAPNTALANPWDVKPPTGLTLASGTDVLVVLGDGTVQTRLLASWTPPADAFVLSGGSMEIQMKRSADETWAVVLTLPGDAAQAYLLDVEDGISYDLRLRSKNGLGAYSAWVTATSHVVLGKSQPPSDVPSLSVQQNGTVCTFQCGAIPDVDLSAYMLRYMPQDLPFDWDKAQLIEELARGTLITNAALPPGPWRVGAKAKDTSGNYSLNAVTYDIVVESAASLVACDAQHPAWPGEITSMVVHPVWGILLPQSIHEAAELGWELFDSFCVDPKPDCAYTTPHMDAEFDNPRIRVWADMDKTAGHGEAGAPALLLELSQSSTPDGLGEFAPWSAGMLTRRYYQARVRPDMSIGAGSLDAMTIKADAEPFSQQGTVIVPVGGLSIEFPKPYHRKPNVQLTSGGSESVFLIRTSLSSTGMTIVIQNASGTDVGGVCDWQATGT